MPDVNTTVREIDCGMDCMEKTERSVSDFFRMIKYDVHELGRAIYQKLEEKHNELEELYDQLHWTSNEEEIACIEEKIAEVRSVIKKLENLKSQQSRLASDFESDGGQLVNAICQYADGSTRKMADYLRQIMKINAPGGSGASGHATGALSDTAIDAGDYYIVIIDSEKYPESAEHIRSAVKMGYPAILTLDRPNARQNRKLSLQGVRKISGLDRDEYPPAVFREGGAGAHIAHISPSDNRGSGASFCHQLRNAADNSRVRFRVI